jgi:hypothetical protein
MTTKQLNELIERYLEGDLPETEQQAFEQRLETDAGLRAAVELQRQLQKHLGNPAELRLRKALTDMWSEKANEKTSTGARKALSFQLLRPYLAVAASIALLIAAWWWMQPSTPPQDQSTAIEQNNPAPVLEPEPHIEAPVSPEENKARRPIARLNPEDFKPNPALELRIGDIRGDGALELNSPVQDTTVKSKTGKFSLAFRGVMNADTLADTQSLRLFVYTNRPEAWEKKRPLADLPFPLTSAGPGKYLIDFTQQLSLNPGLYYLQIGQQRGTSREEGYRTLWVGRVNVII